MKNLLARTSLTLVTAAYLFSATVNAEGAVAPQPIVSANGAISIILPSNGWKEVSYPGACVAFSDGDCGIVFEHYGKDEDIKDIDRKDAGTGILYQSVETGKDMDYVFKAYADTKEEMTQIQMALANAKIDESKIPVDKHEDHPQANEITIEPVNYTAYVTADSLTIREQPNTLSAATGTLSYGDEVTVTGKVLVDGVENGWVQIGGAYICGDFISTEKPEKPAPDPTPDPTPDPNNPTINRTIVTYSASGEYHELYEYSDDSIKDNDGNSYRSYSDGAWTNEQTGEVFTENMPEGGERTLQNDCYADNANGETVHISIYNDGTMFDDDGVQYTAADNAGYTNMNTGDVYYEH